MESETRIDENAIAIAVENGEKEVEVIVASDDIRETSYTFKSTCSIREVVKGTNPRILKIKNKDQIAYFASNIPLESKINGRTIAGGASKSEYDGSIDHVSSLFSFSSTIVFVDEICLRGISDASSLFEACSNLYCVSKISEASGVVNAFKMFESCVSLCDVPSFDVSGIVNAERMFCGCMSITNVPQLNFQNAVTAAFMFEGCSSLSSVNMADLSFPLVETADGMFGGCVSITDLLGYNDSFLSLPNAVSTKAIFSGCSNLSTVGLCIPLSTDISFGFFGCSSLEEIVLPKMANVVVAKSTFFGCENLKVAPTLNFSKLVNMDCMFYGCKRLMYVPLFDTSNVISALSSFGYCTELEVLPRFNFSKALNITEMFVGCVSLSDISISDFSSAKYADNIFRDCMALSEIPEFDFTSLISAASAFEGCVSLRYMQQPKLGKSIENVSRMFKGCTSLKKRVLFPSQVSMQDIW